MAYVALVTIDNTKVPSNQTDFPVYINLADMPSSFWSVVANGGGDIRCFKSDGTTELARDVVSCVTGTNIGEIHVKYTGTLSSSGPTLIQIHADGTSSEPSFSSTYGRNAVWTDYDIVLHMQSGVLDSTGNGHAETSSSGVTTGATGKISNGSSYSGSSSYSFVNGTFTGSSSARTLSCWVKSDVTTGNRFALSYGNDASLQMFGMFSNGSPRWYFTANASDQDSGVNISTSAFQKLTFKYTGTTQIGYVDGVAKTSAATSLNTGTGNFTIGNYPAQTGVPLDGTIDEIRLRKSAVSDDWETTEYNNQNSPSTFYSVAAQTTVNSNFLIFM